MSTENQETRKRERTIKIDENCQFVKNLNDASENGAKINLLAEARNSKINLKKQINDLEDNLDTLYDKVDAAKRKLPLNANAILDAEDDITLAERRLTKAQALYKELFGEEVTA
ncbi:MAG: hypothetical protein WC979_00345 [Candidatus Pacearchaeota archaeon]|jgi:hypothetical protein|nr:hypothetical protein [Clostridia bacterium]